jgi:hypothetical protein
MTTPTITWSSSSSGDWSDAADWGGGVVPTLADNVVINTAGVTVSVSTGTQTAASLVTSLSTLNVNGGELDVGGFAVLNGNFEESAGSLSLAGTSYFYGSLNETGGLLSIGGNGILTAAGPIAVSGGTIASARALILQGATTLSGSGSIETTAGTLSSIGAFTMSGGLLAFNGNPNGSYGGYFYGDLTQTGGLISLGVGSFVTYSNFVENGGTLLLGYAGGTFYGPTSLKSGTISSATAPVLTVDGAYTQTGGLLILNARGGVFAGPMTLGTGGTIQLAIGALTLQGTTSLAGKISGQGTLDVAYGTTTLTSGITLSLPHIDIGGQNTATLALDSTLQSLTLSGALDVAAAGTFNVGTDTVTLTTAAVMDGEIAGNGTIMATAGATLDGGAIDDSSAVDLSGTSNLVNFFSIGSGAGSTARLSVLKGATLRITGNDTIYDASAKGDLTNAGQITKTSGTGTALVYSNFVNIGSVGIAAGSLEFAGRSVQIGGTFGGNGTLVLAGLDTTFLTGVQLGVREIELVGQNQDGHQTHISQNLAFANRWDQEQGTLVLSSHATLSLSGLVSLEGGLISGAGTIATTTSVNIDAIDIEAGAVVSIAGTATQSGSSTTYLGATPGLGAEIKILSGASYFIEQDSSIAGTHGTILNDGFLDKRNGSAGSTITSDLDNVGTLAIGNGALVLDGAAAQLGGTITGAGDFDIYGTATLESGLVLSAAQTIIDGNSNHALISMAGNLSDANGFAISNGGSLQLDGHTLTLSGNAALDSGVIGGQGTPEGGELVATGSLIVNGTNGGDLEIGPSASLLVEGPALQVGTLVIGDTQATYDAGLNSTVTIAGSATYTLDGNGDIAGNGTLSVLGTLSLPDPLPATISTAVVNSGLIQAGNSQLTFASGLTGSGSLTVGPDGLVGFDSTVSSGQTIGMTGGGAGIFIARPEAAPGGDPDPFSFAGTIAGFSSGDYIQLGEFGSNLSTLSISASGDTVSITDGTNTALLDFTSAQSTASLSLVHSDGYVALFHS